jgi:hypothetical protein
MINPKDFVLSPEQLKEHAAQQRDGDRKPKPKKKSRAQFVQLPLSLCRKLAPPENLQEVRRDSQKTWRDRLDNALRALRDLVHHRTQQATSKPVSVRSLRR